MDMTMTTLPMADKFFIHSEMDVLRVRKKGEAMACSMGFNEIERAEIEIAIGEMASNIVKYARSAGELHLIPSDQRGLVCLKVISKNMPVIPAHQEDLEQYLQDGFSSSGSLGIGLSGIRRVMDEFDSTVEESGVIVITAIKYKRHLSENRIRYSVMSFPKRGEHLSGDAFYIKSLPSSFFWGVVDALGHGPGANITALKALNIIENNYSKSLLWIINHCHEALRTERGAAICLGRIDFISSAVEYISIGNIETRIYSGGSLHHLHSVNGTVGALLPKVDSVVEPYIKGSCIVSFTDGISSNFDLERGQLAQSPQEMAYYIINTFRRDYDDTTVMVAK
ncbi:MAG: SpoIIE family protein phosphatase [Desulfamplus sp.]|nr:SpoIIE family protein phosphatase [Desulfamplus sp.]